MDKLLLQKKEFEAAFELEKAIKSIGQVPVVDDYYPEARHHYEVALNKFLDAVVANRILPDVTWAGVRGTMNDYRMFPI